MAGRAGNLFAIHHTPTGPTREAVLFVPPFAEEMNKSRRMFTLLAHELADLGLASLQVDLFGTGDSEGEFGDARWDIWLDDLQRAVGHLRATGAETVHLLALRLGALLAAELEQSASCPVGRVVLWQPVTNGDAFLTQFLRLRMAASLMDGTQSKESTDDLRKLLRGGQSLEIGGYLLAPALADAIATRTLTAAPFARATAVEWIDVVAEAGRALSPASARCVETLRGRGARIGARTVVGEAFWTTIEIAAPAELLAATRVLFSGDHSRA